MPVEHTFYIDGSVSVKQTFYIDGSVSIRHTFYIDGSVSVRHTFYIDGSVSVRHTFYNDSLHANFFRSLAPLSVIFRLRIAKNVLIFKPDPKNNRPIKSHVGIRPRTNMSTIFGRRSFRLQFCEALHYSCR